MDVHQLEPLRGRPRLPAGALGLGEEVAGRVRAFDLLEARGRSAVQDAAAPLTCVRPDVDDPVGMSHDLKVMFDDEQ